MPEPRYRILAVGSHPVQYMSPILRRMALHPQLELHVAYCTLRGAEAAHDPEFGTTVQWDVPLMDGYNWVEVPNKGSGREGFFGLYNPGLWKLIHQGNFDAILCYTGYLRASFWIAYLASKLPRTAFLFGTDTTTLAPLDGRMWKRSVKRILWPALYRLADQVIVPSNGTRDLMRSLGIPEDRITLTPYVVENDWWKAQSAIVNRAAVRASWGATPSTPVVLFCAKLQPWKRPLDLLHAFAQSQVDNALLMLAGDGPLRSQLESEAASLGIRDRLRFLGFVNQTQLPAVYTASDLMVLPSEYDAFGVVVNEAMLCGCAVASSDHVGAARDLIAPVDPSFIYPCGDVAALAHLLRRALTSSTILAEYGQSARCRMDSWSPRENIAGVMEAIEKAVARVRPAISADGSSLQSNDSSLGASQRTAR